MIDQQKNFADKPQTEFRFGALDQRLEETNKSLNKRLDGIDQALTAMSSHSKGLGDGWGYLVALAGLGLLAADIFFKR